MQRTIEDMKKVDHLPQALINKIKEELGEKIKNEIRAMTPLRKILEKSSSSDDDDLLAETKAA